MSARFSLFARSEAPQKTKLLLLAPPDSLPEPEMNGLRSLNLEHVSLAELMRQEISRSTALGDTFRRAAAHGHPVASEAIVALVRRWFWARKPDAGFALAGFPATLLQALVFDEWLDARDESLDGVIAGPAAASNDAVVEHYRTLGLPVEDAVSAAR